MESLIELISNGMRQKSKSMINFHRFYNNKVLYLNITKKRMK